MITFEEARQIILETVKDYGVERVALEDATGRVLREDFYAERDFPPFDRVTMDGIAIQADRFEPGNTFEIEGIAAAGAPQIALQNDRHCLEVMTGAILPKSTNAVIRYEDLNIDGKKVSILLEAIKNGQNIHRKGFDRKAGELLVKSGIQLSPAEIGVAATIGKAQIEVSRLPKCVIVSTGDELVPVEQTPLPYQIRRSNVHNLCSILKTYHINAATEHLTDDLDLVTKRLEELIANYEVLILSGGVSKGKFDYLPTALENIGVKKLFHKVKQRPGKPFWFGKAPGGTLIFALPGNPVSSFMCTQVYFVDWLRKSLGLSLGSRPYGVLEKDLTFVPDLTYFAQVSITYDQSGRMLAKPSEGHGSGDLANLVEADAFIQIPRGKEVFEKGESFPLYFYR